MADVGEVMRIFAVWRWLVCLFIAILLPAAEVTLASPGWTEHASKEAQAQFTRTENQAAITAEVSRYSRLEIPMPVDGTDEAPLRVEARVSLVADGPMRSRSALLSVVWQGGLFAVGVVPGEGARAHQRTAIARWVNGSERGEALGEAQLYPGGAPAFVRIVLSTRDISAWASGDGWTWQRLASLPRSNSAFVGAPLRMAIGKGWPDASQGASLDVDIADKGAASIATYTFSDVRAINDNPSLPSSLLKTYSKGASREETIEQLTASTQVQTWWITGPFPARRVHDLAPYGPEQQPFDPAATFVSGDQRVAWKVHHVGDGPNDHIVAASTLVPGEKDQVRFAATVIDSDESRMERFLFDGKQNVGLYLNGQLIAYEYRKAANAETEADRIEVSAKLNKGRNTLVMMITGDDKGRSTFTLRHEPGDPRYRIALLKRLALDFPDDSELIVSGLQEACTLWAHLGFAAEAAKTIGEISQVGDIAKETTEAMLLEQARLQAQLRDQSAIDSVFSNIQKHWTDNGEADPLTVFQRTALLWQRLDQKDKALAELGEAMKIKELDDKSRLELGLERLLLIEEKKDLAAVRVEMRDIANGLSANNPMRGQLFAEIADRMLWAKQDPANDLALALKSSDARALRRAAGVAFSAHDTAMWIGALKSIAALPVKNSLDSPFVFLAEYLAAQGDTKGAAEAYRQALIRLAAGQPFKEKDATDLSALRIAFIKYTLIESPAGVQILADAAKNADDVMPQSPDIRNWWTIGPFDNANWKCYVDPPVKPENLDVKKQIGDKKWIQPEQKAYGPDSVLDLKGIYNADNCVVFCSTVIASSVAKEATLNMGADDGLVVWMNGVKVHEDRDARGVVANSIQVPVLLKKGDNQLLCMVQNGGSGHALQCRLTSGTIEGMAASSVRFAIAKPDQRIEAAAILQDALENAYRANRVAEGAALTRVLLRAFPDCWEAASTVAAKFVDATRAKQDPVTARLALLWEESSIPLHPRAEATAAWLADKRWNSANCLSTIGDYESAIDLLHASMWMKFDARSQGYYRAYLGDLYFLAGYRERASSYFNGVLAIDGLDQIEERLGRQARVRLAQMRKVKNPLANGTVSFDAIAALRTAERSIDTHDYEKAVAVLQEAIQTHYGQAVAIGNNRLQGISRWCAERLRQLPEAGLEVYRALYGPRAIAALEMARNGDDVVGLERLASDYPISPQAATALSESMRRYLALGADALSAATVEKLMNEFQMAEPERSQLLVAGLRAAARSGERRIFASLAKEFSSVDQALVDGKSVATKTWLAEIGAPLAPALADPAPIATIGAATVMLAPDQLRDVRRFVDDGARTVHVVPVAGSGSGLVYVNTGIDGVAMDLATGALRWRAISERSLGIPVPDSGFSGLPDAGAVVFGGRCVARSRSNGKWCVEARDAVSGALLWSSEGMPELTGMTAVSSPSSDGARVLAVFADASQLAVAAFTLSNGQLAWLTPLALPKNELGFIGGSELGFALAAPTISGRDAYVASDNGAVVALDSGSGSLRWVANYSKITTSVAEGRLTYSQLLRRPVSRVVTSGDHVLVMPRDSLGLLCLSRIDGAQVWRRDFAGGRSFTGVSLIPAGERLVLQGDDVKCLDGSNGQLLWQWQPREGSTIGTGAMGAATVTVSTSSNLHRLALADGSVLQSISWKELGINGSAPGNLQWAGDRLIATGNGGIAILAAAGKNAVNLPIFLPSLARSGQAVIPTTGLKPAAGGAPLALAWRLPCAPIRRFLTPSDAVVGESYLMTRDKMLRLDLGVPSVLWSTPIAGDSKNVSVNRDGVLLIGSATLTMLAREDGSLRWCEPLVVDTMAPLVVDFTPAVIAGENAVLVYGESGANKIIARDRKNGKLLRQFEYDNSVILAAGELGGKVTTVFRRQGKVWSEQRDLISGRSLGVVNVPVSTDKALAFVAPEGTQIVVSGSDAAVVDMATGTASALPFKLPMRIDMLNSGKHTEIFGSEDNKAATWTLWDRDSNAAVFQEKVIDGWFTWENEHVQGYVHAQGRLVHAATKDKKFGIQAKDLNGKELWFSPIPGKGRNSYLHIDVNDSFVFAVGDNRSEQLLDIFDATDGRHIATSAMPGRALGKLHGTHLIGNTWVIVCEGQLVGIAPVPLEALSVAANDQAVPAEQRYVRGLSLISASDATKVMPLMSAGSEMGMTAWMSEWQKASPIVLGPSTVRNGSPAEAQLHLAFDVRMLYVAIEVLDDTPSPRPYGAGPLAGDGVVIGIDGRDEKRSALVLGVHDRDGKPRIDLITGAWAADPVVVGPPLVRVLRGSGRQVYVLALPWSLLLSDPKRAGDRLVLDFGLAIIDGIPKGPPGMRLWGSGLVEGYSPRAWPTIMLVSGK